MNMLGDNVEWLPDEPAEKCYHCGETSPKLTTAAHYSSSLGSVMFMAMIPWTQTQVLLCSSCWKAFAQVQIAQDA